MSEKYSKDIQKLLKKKEDGKPLSIKECVALIKVTGHMRCHKNDAYRIVDEANRQELVFNQSHVYGDYVALHYAE